MKEASERPMTSAKKKSSVKKLTLDSAKLLQTLKDKANKKDFGRKVKDSEILAKAFSKRKTRTADESFRSDIF